MQKEKSFLQTIKLEISRTFTLNPYERIAFHRILGISGTDSGRDILIRELGKGPHIRQSAVSVLVRFENPEALAALVPLLKTDLSESEMIKILNLIEKAGSAENINDIIELIEKNNNPESLDILYHAFNALKKRGVGSDEALNFLIEVINSDEYLPRIKSYAIIALSSFRTISAFESLLKEGDDLICYSVYRSVYELNLLLGREKTGSEIENAELYTYSQESEDKIFLDIRVLLGKMSAAFDSYSVRTKVMFISAMISCNHREFLIYTMKALASEDHELKRMTLYSLFANINLIRDPDKLFRNLIALTSEYEEENDLIINIFHRYFTGGKSTRQFHILKDKLYSYIVVTLESYFETYRKEFMITGVIEKGFPENFQKIRAFILENFNAPLKKKLINYLVHDDSSEIKNIINSISEHIKYIGESDRETLSLLIDILYDDDKKSRENSASRIEDINFEKRYLRTRIIRLCRIIGKLYIEEASSELVNIYNYLKKYPDPKITKITIETLSILNYSYMLGEIEVMLTAGSPDDQTKALQLLSLYTEQRSLNILMDFLKNKIGEDSAILELAVNILVERDIKGNVTANQILKKIIETANNNEIIKLSILGIGRCGFESDIDYLDQLFYRINDGETKDHILRAAGALTASGSGFNKRKLIRNMQEYLKDPGIKVRVYACMFLIKLGYKDALRSIRDMLIIKNKTIQREILNILGGLKSIEFSFFLVSLLKEEYGITDDIISVLEMLPAEDLNEIDGFIVNIFRKYDSPDLDVEETHEKREVISVNNLKNVTVSLLNIDILDFDGRNIKEDISRLIEINLDCKTLIMSALLENNGNISRLSNNKIIAFFYDVKDAVKASRAVHNNMINFRKAGIINKRIRLGIQLITGEAKLLNHEVVDPPDHKMEPEYYPLLANKIIIDNNTGELTGREYYIRRVSEIVYEGINPFQEYFELLYPINFDELTNRIIQEKIEEEEKKKNLDKQLESELKKLRMINKSHGSVAIARNLENIGVNLSNQLKEIEKYIQKRSTDRELIQNVRKMLNNVYNLYKVEISRIIIE